MTEKIAFLTLNLIFTNMKVILQAEKNYYYNSLITKLAALTLLI